MGMFDDISNAESNKSGRYILTGRHLFKVGCLKGVSGHKGDSFVGELEVVESTNEAYSEGDGANFVRNLSNPKTKMMAFGDVKAFIASLSGVAEEAVTPEAVEAAVGESQPFAGDLVKCEAFEKPLVSNPDKMFTRLLWSSAT